MKRKAAQHKEKLWKSSAVIVCIVFLHLPHFFTIDIIIKCEKNQVRDCIWRFAPRAMIFTLCLYEPHNMSILIVCMYVFERAQASAARLARSTNFKEFSDAGWLMMMCMSMAIPPWGARSLINAARSLSDETKEDSICSAKSKIGSQ
jgi:hypothetical protein